jgi:hypothetical protein
VNRVADALVDGGARVERRSRLLPDLQLIGPMFEDRTPLRLAELLEQKIGGFHAPK